MDFMTFREVAGRIGVGIDTVRRNVRRLGLTVRKEKTPASKGLTVHCLSIDDANQLVAYFENRDKPDANAVSSALASGLGIFILSNWFQKLYPIESRLAILTILILDCANIRRQPLPQSTWGIGDARGHGIKPPWAASHVRVASSS